MMDRVENGGVVPQGLFGIISRSPGLRKKRALISMQPLERMDQLVQLVDAVWDRCVGIHAESLLRFGNKDRFSAESSGMADQPEDLHRIPEPM